MSSINILLPKHPIEFNNDNSRITKIRSDFINSIKINSIARTTGLESNDFKNKPFAFTYVGLLPNEDKAYILEEIANRYYERLNIRNLLDINDYLLGVTQSIPNDIKVNISATALMDLENVTIPLINAYNDDIVDNVDNLIRNPTLSTETIIIKINDIQSYLYSILKAIKNNKSNIMSFVSDDIQMDKFFEIEITRSPNCEVCILNKLLLGVYRNVMEILLNDSVCNLDGTSKLAIEKIKNVISPVSGNNFRKQVDYIISQAESQTGVALESFGLDVFKKIANIVIAIFDAILNAIKNFYNFIINLFKVRTSTKNKIELQLSNLSQDEKQKATKAGKPSYYSDPDNQKIYALDSSGRYIVTLALKSPNPFLLENKENVTKRIEENKGDIKPIGSSLINLDDLIRTIISTNDTINKGVYDLIISGKDPQGVVINTIKIVYEYLNNDFKNDAKNAMGRVNKDDNIFSLDLGLFTKLVKILDKINKDLGSNAVRGGSIIDYVNNTFTYIKESSHLVKIDDKLIDKIKSTPINMSYKEFTKLAERPAPILRESIFNKPTDPEAQIIANNILRIQLRLCSFYKVIINQGIKYYQVIYLPLAMAQDIIEVGDKATYLYAAKRKDTKENN